MYTITTTTSDGLTIRGKSFASAYSCIRTVFDLKLVYTRNGLNWTPGYTAEGLKTYLVRYDEPTKTVTVEEVRLDPCDKLYCVYRSRISRSAKVFVQALNREDAELIAGFYIDRNIRYVSDSFPPYVGIDDYDYCVTEVTSKFAHDWMLEADYISAVGRPESAAGIKAGTRIQVPVTDIKPDLYPGDSMLVYLGNNRWKLVISLEESV